MFPGVHVDRITRGYRDYRDPGQLAFVRLKQGKGNFSEDSLQQQSSPDRDRVVDVCRRLSADTSLQRHAICLSGEQEQVRCLQLLESIAAGLRKQLLLSAQTFPAE